MAYLLGIDAGTTTMAAAVFDSDGGLVGNALVECADFYRDNKIVEIDMDNYWRALISCLERLKEKSGIDLHSINALSISSQGVTFVPVDNEGYNLGHAIVYYDTRAGNESEEIIREFGDDWIFSVTGQPSISPLFEAAKLLWIRKHEKERFEKIGKLLLVHDYLTFKLTGEFVTVSSLQSSSLLFDIHKKRWWVDMLDFLGFKEERLPEIYRHGDPVAKVCKAASKETGLSTSTVVVTGAIDQVCGMIGIGNIHKGAISESTGSVLAIHTVSNEPFKKNNAGIHTFCNAIDSTYALIGICPAAGSAFRWFKECFGEEDQRRAEIDEVDVFDLLTSSAEEIDPGAEGLIMLPHLAGRGSPKSDPAVRGVFYGIGLHHKKPHFVRALMESVAFLIRENLQVFRENLLNINEIRSFGGGSRSRSWNQIKADICCLPLVTSTCSEAGCLGAAILAGFGIHEFSSIEEGCQRLVLLDKPILPNERNKKKYEAIYKLYQMLNEALEPVFTRSQELQTP